jgi:hypothetical protein
MNAALLALSVPPGDVVVVVVAVEEDELHALSRAAAASPRATTVAVRRLFFGWLTFRLYIGEVSSVSVFRRPGAPSARWHPFQEATVPTRPERAVNSG